MIVQQQNNMREYYEYTGWLKTTNRDRWANYNLPAANFLHIIQYHIVVLKRQKRLKVGTDKPKSKVKMQSVSGDDVRKRLLEKPRFALAAKDVLLLQCISTKN